MNNTLIRYAIRNSQGLYLKAKSYSLDGGGWVVDINKAKIYSGTGSARTVITWYDKYCPNLPTPDLIKITMSGIEVMDESGRLEKVKENKEKALVKRDKRIAEQNLKEAQRKLDEALVNLNKLQK